MTTRNHKSICAESNRYLSRVLAGLLIAVTMVVGVLLNAVADVQAFI